MCCGRRSFTCRYRAVFATPERAERCADRRERECSARSSSDPKIVYPESKKVDQVDDYFGTKVADPYRWLEDETSAETKAWIEDQNKVTFAYLDRIPYREKLKTRLTELYNYPRISALRFVVVTLTSSRRTTGCKIRASTTFKKALTARLKFFSIQISSPLTAQQS